MDARINLLAYRAHPLTYPFDDKSGGRKVADRCACHRLPSRSTIGMGASTTLPVIAYRSIEWIRKMKRRFDRYTTKELALSIDFHD